MSIASRRGRLGTMAAIVLTGLLVGTQATLAGLVPPNEVKGIVGKWSLHEGWKNPNVTCTYRYRQQAIFKHKLSVVDVKAPKVFWPNRRANRSTEHGKIGWQLRIKEWVPDTLRWRKVYDSGIQKSIAYERKKAPLIGIGLDWNVAGDHLYFFQHRIIWYRQNGTVLGTVKTWSKYALNADDIIDGVLRPASCPNRNKDPYP